MRILQILRKIAPPQIIRWLRPAYYRAIDWVDSNQRTRSEMIPPKSLRMQVGWGDFKQIGDSIRQRLVETAALQPDDHLLDVGCGVGRIAIALLDYLSDTGEYQGFDVMHDAIEWCQKKIATQRTNFHFFHSNVYNGIYNPSGRIKAAEYRFPFEDNRFDIVILTSVFTHMLPLDHENYLSEIARILKPKGRTFITYYIINSTSRKHMQAGTSCFNFKFEYSSHCYYEDKDHPEAVVGYEEGYLYELYSSLGLTIREPTAYGDWSRQELEKSQQDVIVAIKK